MGRYRTSHRSRAEGAALRQRVLEMWAAGEYSPAIAKACEIPHSYVRSIIARAKRAGDPLAVSRLGQGRPRTSPPGTSRGSKGINRTRVEAADLRERVLARWATGERALDVAAACGIAAGYAQTIIRQARRAGHPLAVPHKPGSPKGTRPQKLRTRAESAALKAEVMTLRAAGERTRVIAEKCGITRDYAYAVVRLAKRAKEPLRAALDERSAA